MTNRTMAVGFLILIVGHVGVATAQDRKFVDKLVESRFITDHHVQITAIAVTIS